MTIDELSPAPSWPRSRRCLCSIDLCRLPASAFPNFSRLLSESLTPRPRHSSRTSVATSVRPPGTGGVTDPQTIARLEETKSGSPPLYCWPPRSSDGEQGACKGGLRLITCDVVGRRRRSAGATCDWPSLWGDPLGWGRRCLRSILSRPEPHLIRGRPRDHSAFIHQDDAQSPSPQGWVSVGASAETWSVVPS
jgi:hypothetical protein